MNTAVQWDLGNPQVSPARVRRLIRHRGNTTRNRLKTKTRPAVSPATPAELIAAFSEQTSEYAVLCLDPDGIIRAWRGAAEKIFGYAEQETLGQSAALLFTSEDKSKGFDKQELEVASRDSRSEDDRWHVRKDGTRVWVMGCVQAIRSQSGDIVGFIKLMRDRTDLRTHIDHLENQLLMREGAIERTHGFLRTLGHELRNPLAPLRTAAEIVKRLNQAPQVGRAADIILAQVAVLTQLTGDLMEVSRLEARKVVLALECVDLREPLREACVAFSPVASDKGLDMQLFLPEGALDVRLDRQRFQQVTSNLLTNAIKYTPAGGHVWIKPTQEGREVLLRIEDTGIGIPSDLLPRLFDLFSRSPSARELAPTGLGVGLAVVREIVELHGGTIQARSGGAGTGAEFTVRLPAASQ
jgi:PAS domain S-box-containing protein